VVVTQVVSGSVAALAGIRSGTLILEVNRKHVHNIAEFDEALAQTSSKGVILLLVKEGSGSRYIALSFEK